MGYSAIAKTTIQGFSRLKGVFRSGINYSQYDKIVSTAKNTVIGNLPNDMLSLIIKSNPFNKADSIKTIQGAFDDAVINLSKIDKVEINAMKRFKPSSDNVVKLFKTQDFYIDEIFQRDLAKITLETERILLKKIQPVLSDLASVRISHLGLGAYGNTFRCDFLNSSGEKLINDKVIKIFREYDYSTTYIDTITNVLNRFSIKNIMRTLKKSKINVKKEQIEQQQKMFTRISEALKSNECEYMARIHGANPEANISEFLKFYSGHKVKPSDGLVIPDMFKLGKNSYQISEFVGKTTKATKKYNFERIGLEHSDLSLNPGNRINGICIDIGGIVPSTSSSKVELAAQLQKSGEKVDPSKQFFEVYSSSIIGDKFMTKLLKRFMNCKTVDERLTYLKNLEESAKNTKNCIERRKILSTVEEIKDKYANSLKPFEVIDDGITVSKESLNSDIARALDISA